MAPLPGTLTRGLAGRALAAPQAWPMGHPVRRGAKEFYTERLVRELLRSLCGRVYEEARMPDRNLYIDAAIVDPDTGLRTVFEIDGAQHFGDYRGRWGDLGVTRARDVYKTLWCLSCGHNIVRIHQPSAVAEGALRPEIARAVAEAAGCRAHTDPVYIAGRHVGASPWAELRSEVAVGRSAPLEDWLRENEVRMRAPKPAAPGRGIK